MTIFGIMYRYKNAEILQGESSALEKVTKYVRITKNMDKKRLKIALAMLDAVKINFPETKKFIDDTTEDECQKEKISADEVFFYKSRSKEKAQKNIFGFAMSMLRDIVIS